MTFSYLQDLPFYSPVSNTSIACMQEEDDQIGVSEASRLLVYSNNLYRYTQVNRKVICHSIKLMSYLDMSPLH